MIIFDTLEKRKGKKKYLMATTGNKASSVPVDARSQYPDGVPGKFDPDGNVQPFPGNTTVCHLSPTSELFGNLLELYKKLKSCRLASKFTLLPPSSWHMTVFEGVCDQVRQPAFWPDNLPLDIPLEECTSIFEKKLSSFALECQPPYLMSVTGFDPLEIGIGVHLEPRTTEESARLRNLRDRLSEHLHIRHPSHNTYGLHFSLAYLLRHLSDGETAELRALLNDHFKTMPVEFELGAPEFCRFKDMFAFERIMYLH
jgi:hypothetical protein